MNMDPELNGDQEPEEGMNELSMEQLMESSLQSLKEGEVVHGTVVAVDSEEVLVDIGYKCEGSVPVTEFIDPETKEVTIKVNDEVEVFVERMDEVEGRVRLSRDRAAKLKTWRSICVRSSRTNLSRPNLRRSSSAHPSGRLVTDHWWPRPR